jgi:transcription elongation factor GreA
MNTTISEKTILISKKGMKELKKSIQQLEHDHKKAMQSLRELDKTLGHEEKLQRIETLAQIDSIETEIEEKRQLLAASRLLPSKRARLKVAIGSVVDLIDVRGHLFRYKIVDSIEANPSDGRISTQSPLGKNLIGRTVKDIVSWGNGSRFKQFRLVRIS